MWDSLTEQRGAWLLTAGAPPDDIAAALGDHQWAEAFAEWTADQGDAQMAAVADLLHSHVIGASMSDLWEIALAGRIQFPAELETVNEELHWVAGQNEDREHEHSRQILAELWGWGTATLAPWWPAFQQEVARLTTVTDHFVEEADGLRYQGASPTLTRQELEAYKATIDGWLKYFINEEMSVGDHRTCFQLGDIVLPQADWVEARYLEGIQALGGAFTGVRRKTSKGRQAVEVHYSPDPAAWKQAFRRFSDKIVEFA